MPLLLLGGLLLTYQIDSKDLWGDEVFSISLAKQSVSFILIDSTDIHPPLYYILLHFWMRSFGDSAKAVRLFSVIPSVLSSILLYKIGLELTNERKLGLMSAYLFTISPFLTLYSRMARYFSLAMFLGLSSFYFFIPLLNDKSGKSWLGYVVSSLLLLYTSYLGIFLILCEGLVLLRQKRTLIRQWMISSLAIGLIYLPWIYRMTKAISRVHRGHVADLNQTFIGALVGVSYSLFSYGVGETLYPWNVMAIIAFGIYMLSALSALIHWRHDRHVALLGSFISLPLIFTILTIFYIATYKDLASIPSRIMYVFPFFILFVAIGILKLKNLKIRIISLVLITSVSSYSLVNYYRDKQFLQPAYIIPWRMILDYIDDEAMGKSIIVTRTSHQINAPAEYYSKTLSLPFFLKAEEAQIYIHENKPSFIWLIVTHRESSHQPNTDFVEWLEEDYLLVSKKGFLKSDETFNKVKRKFLLNIYEHKVDVILWGRKIE